MKGANRVVKVGWMTLFGSKSTNTPQYTVVVGEEQNGEDNSINQVV